METTTKQVKKLTIEIVDEKALAEAFPELMREVKALVPNRQLLYPIAKAFHDIGRQVPGVNAYYAAEGVPESAQGEEEGAGVGGNALLWELGM